MNMKKYVFSIMMLLLPMLANADNSGVCGDGLTFSFVSETNTLTISKTGEGTGKMYDYESSFPCLPIWSDYYQSDVHNVIIEDGVTSIGNCAFFACYLLTSVTIPATSARASPVSCSIPTTPFRWPMPSARLWTAAKPPSGKWA